MDWLLYEKEAISKGYANVCGVDEAGRGPWRAQSTRQR